jgi:hypothetical protein
MSSRHAQQWNFMGQCHTGLWCHLEAGSVPVAQCRGALRGRPGLHHGAVPTHCTLTPRLPCDGWPGQGAGGAYFFSPVLGSQWPAQAPWGGLAPEPPSKAGAPLGPRCSGQEGLHSLGAHGEAATSWPQQVAPVELGIVCGPEASRQSQGP